MRKAVVTLGLAALIGISLLLLYPVDLPAQWGLIREGADAARRGSQESAQPAPPAKDAPHNVAGEAVGGKGLAAATAFKNRVRPFSYTIPAGWRQEGSGDPAGESVNFMLPGTTCAFIFHFTQMVPSFPRKASVDASYKQAMEEKGIGKYISVKRRDQAGAQGIIGWETIESPTKGSGGFQRIQWQCYDKDNYYYSFIASSDPRQFEQHRAALQGIINSVRFGR
jgi:hypothetical protein